MTATPLRAAPSLAVSLALTTALAALAPLAQAQSANLADWTAAGSVTVTSPGQATLGNGTGALLYDDLEAALAIRTGTLAADTFEGSGLALSFTVGAPVSISFNWLLASTEPFDAGFADRGFVVLDGVLLRPLGALAADPVSGSFSVTFTAAGSHALAIGLVDVNDTTGDSTLTLSQFSVSAVPEPAHWALLLAGAAGLGAWARRRRG